MSSLPSLVDVLITDSQNSSTASSNNTSSSTSAASSIREGHHKQQKAKKSPNSKDIPDRASQPKKQKGPKGPKGGKPKPISYDYYYQHLAAELTKAQGIDTSEVGTSGKDVVLPGAPGVTNVTETLTRTTSKVTTVVKERRLTIQFKGHDSSLPTPPSSLYSSIPLTPHPSTSSPKPQKRSTRRSTHTVFTLDNIPAVAALEHLLAEYGGIQHGGILDPAYSFFVYGARSAAISFIVKNKTAVLGGDPLCPPLLFESVFAEFAVYRKRNKLGIAISGASEALLAYGKERNWPSIRIGTETVLNPMSNPVLQEKVQKQVVRQNKQLLDPAKYGHTLGIYTPSIDKVDPVLQSQLSEIYDAWRTEKNASGLPQSYSTIYDPFALPRLMMYIYTRDSNGVPNGFAALRKMGSRNGYYIDPCIAATGAHRRITDLLYFTAMAVLNAQGCGYLAVGMKPSAKLELQGFPTLLRRAAKSVHGRIFDGLRLSGKGEYFAKFRPEEALGGGLYLMFPDGAPGPRQLLACVHHANISLKHVAREKVRKEIGRRRKRVDASNTAVAQNQECTETVLPLASI